MKKQYQTIVVKIQETSRRTVEYDCEVEVPFDIYTDADKSKLTDFLDESICDSKKVSFVDIVDSEHLKTEILDFKEGTLPNEIIDRYTIIL